MKIVKIHWKPSTKTKTKIEKKKNHMIARGF